MKIFFHEIQELSDPLIDSNATELLSKTVHVTSVILFVHKENKNNDLIQQFFSSKSRIPPLLRIPQRMRVLRQQHHVHSLFTCRGTLDNGGKRDLEENNCWIKLIFLRVWNDMRVSN